MPRVFDAFIFYNEIELLEIRLNELANVVDHFLLVEAGERIVVVVVVRVPVAVVLLCFAATDRTFTYREKPLHFKEHEEEFDTFAHQLLSFNCQLPEHPAGAQDEYKAGWNREHAQRACINEAIQRIFFFTLLLFVFWFQIIVRFLA